MRLASKLHFLYHFNILHLLQSVTHLRVQFIRQTVKKHDTVNRQTQHNSIHFSVGYKNTGIQSGKQRCKVFGHLKAGPYSIATDLINFTTTG
jgi:hypothetical protein